MAPDDYKLRVSADPSVYQAQWYYNSSDPEDAYDITIDPGTHDSGWNFQLADATMSIGGNVYDQSFSAPLKGATVQLFASADPATALATTTTVGDGSYLFSGLTAGNYLVEFTDAPLFTPQWYSFATDPGDATEITLIPGQHPGAYGYLTPSADWAAYGSVGITGTPSVGSTLTAVPAGWSPRRRPTNTRGSSMELRFRWAPHRRSPSHQPRPSTTSPSQSPPSGPTTRPRPPLLPSLSLRGLSAQAHRRSPEPRKSARP